MMLTHTISLVATDACDKSGGFFGLIPWYHYLPKADLSSSCDITSFNILPGNGAPSDIPLVLIAVVDDLLRIAGLVALGFIIYGAFLYVGSQGSPDQTTRARTTIINALIGLAIAVTAIVFVSFLGSQFGGS